jgi:hypothetical protein
MAPQGFGFWVSKSVPKLSMLFQFLVKQLFIGFSIERIPTITEVVIL